MTTEIKGATNEKPPPSYMDFTSRCFLAIGLLRREVRQHTSGNNSLTLLRGARLLRRGINL
jgi:hypothetical protein